MRLTALLTSLTFFSFSLLPPAACAQLQLVQRFPTAAGAHVVTATSPGWQLLPSLALTTQAASTALSGVSYTDVRAYNPSTSSLTSTTQVSTGQAYWVNVSATSTWSPPLPKNVTTSYTYDGDGGKVKQVTGAGTTTYLGEVYEKDPTAKTTKYVFAGSQRIAAKASDGTLRFFHSDHLGSSNVVTDASGQQVEMTEYTPYGSVSAQQPTPPAPRPSPQPGENPYQVRKGQVRDGPTASPGQ